MEIYIVNEGDTITDIARRFNVSASRLSYDNEVFDGEIVKGQALLIARPQQQYVIEEGDTLTGIAEQFGTSVEALLRNNSYLLNDDFLIPGRQIVISYEIGEEQNFSNIGIYGYAYPFIREDILDEACLYIDELLPFSYGFNDDGSLIQLNDEGLIDTAVRFGNSLRMVLTPLDRNGRFNNQRVVRLLSDIPVQNRLISEMLDVLSSGDYIGVDIDFEFIPGEFREEYVMFVDKTRRILNDNGYTLSVALPPKISDDQPGLLYEGIDYAGLGEAADIVFLMTYEWGYKYGPPLAVAPIPSVRKVLDYAVSRISRDKIFMGIPNYAYDWPLPYMRGETVADTIGNTEAVKRAYRFGTEILFDNEAMAPYYYYTDNEVEHVVWFEDVRSIAAKYSLIQEYGFAGAGYWNLMREFRQNFMYLNLIRQ